MSRGGRRSPRPAVVASSLILLGARVLHPDALMRSPDPDLGDIGLADHLNADARVFPSVRCVRSADDLPFAGLVRKAIANAKVHRKDLAVGRCLRLPLLVGAVRHETLGVCR